MMKIMSSFYFELPSNYNNNNNKIFLSARTSIPTFPHSTSMHSHLCLILDWSYSLFSSLFPQFFPTWAYHICVSVVFVKIMWKDIPGSTRWLLPLVIIHQALLVSFWCIKQGSKGFALWVSIYLIPKRTFGL